MKDCRQCGAYKKPLYVIRKSGYNETNLCSINCLVNWVCEEDDNHQDERFESFTRDDLNERRRQDDWQDPDQGDFAEEPPQRAGRNEAQPLTPHNDQFWLNRAAEPPVNAPIEDIAVNPNWNNDPNLGQWGGTPQGIQTFTTTTTNLTLGNWATTANVNDAGGVFRITPENTPF